MHQLHNLKDQILITVDALGQLATTAKSRRLRSAEVLEMWALIRNLEAWTSEIPDKLNWSTMSRLLFGR